MIKRIIIPPPLKPGDKVAVIAPSGVVNEEAVRAALPVIESWQLEVVCGRNLFGSSTLFAGTDSQRLADLQEALDDSSVAAILCARGGYGLTRLAGAISFEGFRRSPKWIVGFSDITVLHLLVNKLCSTASIHGEVVANYANSNKTERSVMSVRNLLFGAPQSCEWEGKVLNPATAEGVLTGGNLSIIHNMAAAGLLPDMRGKILFLEDIGEYHYHIDRMLSALKLAGVLRDLKAIVTGQFTAPKDGEIPFGKTAEEIVADIAGDYGYPIYTRFPAGHDSDNVALLMGAETELSVSDGRCSLRLHA